MEEVKWLPLTSVREAQHAGKNQKINRGREDEGRLAFPGKGVGKKWEKERERLP